MKVRLLKYDIIRIVAIILVVLTHVSAYLVVDYPVTYNSTFIIGNVFNGISHAGTPLFLMLSGALLLDEEKRFSVKRFYKKSFCSICVLLALWLFLYAVFYTFILPLIQKRVIDIHRFIYYLLFEGRYKHLWYLYMLIGAYTVIPVLRLFVKKENKSYIIGMIVLCLAVQFFPQTTNVFTRNKGFTVSDFVEKFHFEYATGYIAYLLIGWYLGNIPLRKGIRIALMVLGLTSMVTIILIVQLNIDGIPNIRSYVAEMDTLPAALYGIGVFTLIQSIAGDRHTKSASVLHISDAAFGIYILHIIFLELLTNKMLSYSTFQKKNPLLYIIVLFLAVFSSSALSVMLISKIKGIRYIFHYVNG